MERLRQLRAELEAYLSRLSPRERLMVGGAGGAIALFLVLMISFGISRSITNREKRIEEKTQLLAQVGKLTQGYRAAEAARRGLESKLQGPPTQLISFVTQITNRLSIPAPEDLRNLPSGGSDKVREEQVEVNLPKLELPRLARLLEELERGSGIVKVRYLRVSTTSADPNVVDVTMRVSTFQLKG